MRRNVISILLCCLSLVTKAQNKILLKGTIGSYPIVLDLTIYEDSLASVRYFYENQKKDIELDGKVLKDGAITVVSVVSYNNHEERFDSRSEKLELKKIKNGYTGKWSTTKKNLPVHLTNLVVEEIKHPFAHYTFVQKLKEEDPLDYVRIAGLQFIKDSTTQKGGYFLDWYHEKHSHIKLFRLRKEVMTAAIKKVNDHLEKTQLGESNAALSCISSRGETDYNNQVDHIFLTKDLLSINISTSYYCGGAHPDFGSTGFNFDLVTGSPIELDDILWFGKRPVPEKHSDGWYNYRDAVFAPAVVSLLRQLYPNEMKKPTDEEACDYSDPQAWDFPNWYLTQKGLYIGAYFARVARACDEPEWSVIPYSLVKKYMSPSLAIKLPE